MSVLKKLAFLTACIFSLQAHAECLMDSPETTLRCYEEYVHNKDIASLKSIYWDLEIYRFSDKTSEKISYKIIERKVYERDLKFQDDDTDIPIWRKKGNVELISEKYINGQKNTYSHTFRKINGKWFMVSHFRHGLENFIDE